jgi:integrase
MEFFIMATIRKITRSKGVVYSAVIKDKNGSHLKSKTFARLADARAWVKRIESDDEQMEALGMAGAGMTFSELIDEYMQQWQGRDLNQVYRLEHWRGVIGKYKLVDITAALLRQKLKEYHAGRCKRGNGKQRSKTLNKPRAAASVNRHRSTISGALSYAVREGYLMTNPMQKVPSQSVNNGRVRYLSDGEREALFAACKQSAWPKLYLIVVLATCTGMRKGEMLGLRWSDIDFDEGLAYLEMTKNGEPRVCPIPSPALAELKRHREIGNGLVFPSNKKPGQPLEFKKHWLQALEAAGVENFRFHDLRHTAASYLVMQGATLHETAEILGHKDLATTRRYAHLSTEHKKRVAERVMSRKLGL